MLAAAVAASQIAFAANRAPSTYGEIYRVAANGAVTNLTHDPAADISPSASPDGRLVAFARQRAASVQVYVVGSDGRSLRAVSPRLPGGGLREGVAVSIAWAPDGRRLAVELSRGGNASTLYLTSREGRWRAVDRGLGQAPPAWSADGRLVAATSTAGLVDVVDTATGKRLWRVGGTGVPAWSRGGLLAVHANSETIDVYDARGRSRASFPGEGFAWSGDRLASLDSGVLELRAGGAGRPSLRARLGPAQPDCDCAVTWVGANTIRARTGADVLWHGYDVAHRRRLPGTEPFDTVWSAAGDAAHVRFGYPTVALVRGTTDVRVVPSCSDDDPFENVQFLGRTTALLYASACPLPSGDLYSVVPDGSALRRLTDTPTDDFDPALSPDGTRVAWSQQLVADRCKGCPHELWTSAPPTQLTKHSDDERAPFDDNPTFSPDGAELAFVRAGPDARPVLYTMPAAGGTPLGLGVADMFGQIAWGTQGIAYATGYQPASIRVVNPSTRAVTTLATEAKLDVSALAWSSDGRLAYLANDGNGHSSIAIVGGRTIRLAQRGVTGLAWSPDGAHFAYVASDANGYGEVWTIATDGTGVRQVTHDLGVVGTLSWR